jgi:uncharacterized protein RhaS with RHS repeats
MGARYYDPVGGRWLSPDPLGHDSDPSLYSFGDGDPNDIVDADGRVGKKNGPPHLELGVAQVMRQRIETTYYWANGKSTGPTSEKLLYDAASLGGRSYTTVTEPTGDYFFYVGPEGTGSQFKSGTAWQPITKLKLTKGRGFSS